MPLDVKVTKVRYRVFITSINNSKTETPLMGNQNCGLSVEDCCPPPLVTSEQVVATTAAVDVSALRACPNHPKDVLSDSNPRILMAMEGLELRDSGGSRLSVSHHWSTLIASSEGAKPYAAGPIEASSDDVQASIRQLLQITVLWFQHISDGYILSDLRFWAVPEMPMK